MEAPNDRRVSPPAATVQTDHRTGARADLSSARPTPAQLCSTTLRAGTRRHAKIKTAKISHSLSRSLARLATRKTAHSLALARSRSLARFGARHKTAGPFKLARRAHSNGSTASAELTLSFVRSFVRPSVRSFVRSLVRVVRVGRSRADGLCACGRPQTRARTRSFGGAPLEWSAARRAQPQTQHTRQPTRRLAPANQKPRLTKPTSLANGAPKSRRLFTFYSFQAGNCCCPKFTSSLARNWSPPRRAIVLWRCSHGGGSR